MLTFTFIEDNNTATFTTRITMPTMEITTTQTVFMNHMVTDDSLRDPCHTHSEGCKCAVGYVERGVRRGNCGEYSVHVNGNVNCIHDKISGGPSVALESERCGYEKKIKVEKDEQSAGIEAEWDQQ